MHVVSEGELTEKAGASKTEDNYGWRSQSGDESFDVGAIQGRTIDTALVQGRTSLVVCGQAKFRLSTCTVWPFCRVEGGVFSWLTFVVVQPISGRVSRSRNETEDDIRKYTPRSLVGNIPLPKMDQNQVRHNRQRDGAFDSLGLLNYLGLS